MSARAKAPAITISAERMPLLERLAEGMETRNPALAERFLGELARAKVTPEARLAADVVDLGRSVTFRDETNGKVQTVVLVMPEHADIDAGKASVATPIGIALIGLKTGASFVWEARDGKQHQLTVLSVGAPPEAAADSGAPDQA